VEEVCGLSSVLFLTCGVCEAALRQMRIVWNVDAASACVYVLKVQGKPWQIPSLTTTAESGAVRPVAGLLATGVRVGGSRSPLYATIGTTIDNNIFRTLMVGGAVFIARWRSSIVAGALTSRGATEADLAPTIRAYSNGGVALDGLDLDEVPLDDRPYRGHVAACLRCLGCHRHYRTIADATLQPARPAHTPDVPQTWETEMSAFWPDRMTRSFTGKCHRCPA
jgi:hypothetical protein